MALQFGPGLPIILLGSNTATKKKNSNVLFRVFCPYGLALNSAVVPELPQLEEVTDKHTKSAGNT